MLYKFRFKNFRSFATDTEISFQLKPSVPDVDTTFTTPRGMRLSKMIAVLGANGAGKSNILQALSFLGWFVRRSFASDPDDMIMIDGHRFSKDDASEFEMEFEHDDEHYRYKLNVDNERVISESLYHQTSTSFSYLFKRNLNANGDYQIQYKKDLSFSLDAARVRHNASLISTAAQYNVPYARKITNYFAQIATHGRFYYSDNFGMFTVAKFFHRNPELHEKMVKFIKQVDLGLSDISIDMESYRSRKTSEMQTRAIPSGVHHQNGKSFKLPFWNESEGTQEVFRLLHKILPALERGGLVVLDELDSGLHPEMVMSLLGLFRDASSNPHNAQVIFTSYIPDVMDTLLKEQMLLVEKIDGHSEAWRLSDMQGVRKDDNYYGKYRAGAYGATPDI